MRLRVTLKVAFTINGHVYAVPSFIDRRPQISYYRIGIEQRPAICSGYNMNNHYPHATILTVDDQHGYRSIRGELTHG